MSPPSGGRETVRASCSGPARCASISDDGRVWAQRAVHGDERRHWTEVDLQGPLRRQVILPERFSLRAIAGGKLYGVARDELDVQRVAFLERP